MTIAGSPAEQHIAGSGLETWSRRREGAVILAIVAAAMFIRLYFLGFHDVISTDGTSYVGAARGLNNGDIGGLSIYGFYPLLIWLGGLLGPGMETSGRLVSVFSGSLLVVPLYLLGRELFSRPTAIAASLLTLAWPPLLSWSCEVMTQATYATLALTGIYFVWRLFRRPGIACGAAAGLCFGLAFLTRPEGLLLFFVTPLAPLFARRRQLQHAASALAAYGGVFCIILGVNLLLIHQVTGHWQLSAKTGSALNDAISYYLQIPDLNYIPSYKARGYLDIIRDYPAFILTNTLNNLKDIWKILPLPLWGLALAGICAGGLRGEGNVGRFFLLSTFAPLLVITVFYYATPEYTQPYLPVLFLWCAEGGRRAEALLGERLARHCGQRPRRWVARVPLTMAAAGLFTAILFWQQLPTAASSEVDDGGRHDQKRLGLLLKENLPPGKIMTRWARIAYYAEREWINIPKSPLEHIVSTARQSGVRFLVVDGSLFVYRPELGRLIAPLGPEGPESLSVVTPNYEPMPLGLRPYLLFRDPMSIGVAVYELVPEHGNGGS